METLFIWRLAQGLAPFSFQFYHKSGSWQFTLLLWTSITLSIKGEARHIFLMWRALSSFRIKSAIIKCCVLMFAGRN